jgi:hypothetical protein
MGTRTPILCIFRFIQGRAWPLTIGMERRVSAGRRMTDRQRVDRLRAFVREHASSPKHLKWVKSVRRQVETGNFDNEPMDLERLRERFKR